MVEPSKTVWRFNYPMLLRIMTGMNDEAKSLLRELQLPCDLVDRSGKTLLHYSVKYRNLEMVQHLIEIGYNVDVQDNDGFTPLMLASDIGDETVLEVLLKSDADIYCVQRNEMSNLQFALHKRLFKYTDLCLEQKSDFIFEIFMDRVNKDFLRNKRKIMPGLFNADNLVKLAVVAFGNLELAKFILTNNYPIDYREPETGRTALHRAIIFGKDENAKLLTEHGANAGLKDSFGKTPLDYYPQNLECTDEPDEQSELLRILLKAQRNEEILNSDLQNLLTRGSKDTVRMLLASDIDLVSMTFKIDKSLLHVLLANQNFDDLDFLTGLIMTCDFNIFSNRGTPLMIAVRSGCSKKVELLLQHGADVNSTAPDGQTALFLVCLPYGHPDTPDIEKTLMKTIELLLQYGADVQAVMRYRNTILDVINSSGRSQRFAEIIVAHLAVLGASDHVLLTDHIRDKIESDQKFKSHFDFCTRQVEEMKGMNIYGTIAMFDLLAEKQEKMVLYARNQQFLSAFDCIMEKCTHLQPYYLNTLHKKVTQALDKIELDKKAAAVIEMLTGLCSDAYHAIIYEIISYLSLLDLKNLCKVEYVAF